MNEKIAKQNERAQDNIVKLAATQKNLGKLENKAKTLQIKVDISSSVAAFHETNNYKAKISELNQSLAQSKIKSDALEKDIQRQSEDWEAQYDRSQRELKSSLEESNNKNALKQIQQLVEQIKDKEAQITKFEVEMPEEEPEILD